MRKIGNKIFLHVFIDLCLKGEINLKVSSISSPRVSSNYQQNNNNSSNPSFKGFADGCVKFWQFIDNGGRALQFTAEDMTGTNIPRSIKGLLAGIKYTGHLNIPAFLQEAIREFLTGPTMCVTPFAILTLAKKTAGKSANTHLENINNLSYIMQNTKKAEGETLKDAFYKSAAQDLIKQSAGEDAVTKVNVENIVSGIKDYSKANDKKDAAEVLSSLQKTYEKIVKTNKKDYSDCNFLAAKYSISDSKSGATKFKNYIEYIEAYANDFTKRFGENLNADNIKKFKTNWLGKRAITCLSMFFITGILMYQIPKLYTKASGRINPNASAIYDEAKKRDNDKEVKNG